MVSQPCVWVDGQDDAWSTQQQGPEKRCHVALLFCAQYTQCSYTPQIQTTAWTVALLKDLYPFPAPEQAQGASWMMGHVHGGKHARVLCVVVDV